jgi:hypothetical protein
MQQKGVAERQHLFGDDRENEKGTRGVPFWLAQAEGFEPPFV